MKIADVLEPALMFDLETPISKLVSEMYRKKRQEAVILDGKEYAGMISARDIAKRTINNPDRVMVKTLKSDIRNIPPFSPEAEPREIIETILINGYTSVPVNYNGELKILTKLSLVSLLPKDVLKDKRASDVAVFPFCISPQDSFAVARSIIRQMRAFRLVIVNEHGRTDGVLDSIDLLRTVINTDKSKRGELAGDKVKLRDVLASSTSLMQDTFVKVSPDTPLNKVAEIMVKNKNPTVIVEESKLEGIITPESILKLLSKEVSGIYIRVTGQQNEDTFLRSVLDEELRHEVSKLGKLIPIDYLTLNVKKFGGLGRRTKYSLKAKLVTQKGLFVSQAHAWDITKAMHELMARLEREVMKKKGKLMAYRRGPVSHFTDVKIERA